MTLSTRCPATDLPDEAYAAALAALPHAGPSRLRALLGPRADDGVGAQPDPAATWHAVAAGTIDDGVLARLRTRDPRALVAAWRGAATTTADPVDVWAACKATGIRVLLERDHDYPPPLAADPEPPAVLFVRGDLGVLDARRAAVVGTRRCTSSGAFVARRLGADLADARVAVVSGLALGIDGAAHTGALAVGNDNPDAAAPIGVVGSGLDVVYPRRHDRLWDAVAQRGVLLSEAPPGARPERWRFPARNRILAALAEVVVVVESHARGGSQHTVDAAIERGVTVMAVPGSVRCPAAEGTNLLLADGVAPALSSRDVLVALGIPPPPKRPGKERVTISPTSPTSVTPDGGLVSAVLAALSDNPATLDDVAARTGRSVGAVAAALHELRASGRVSHERGWWSHGSD